MCEHILTPIHSVVFLKTYWIGQSALLKSSVQDHISGPLSNHALASYFNKRISLPYDLFMHDTRFR